MIWDILSVIVSIVQFTILIVMLVAFTFVPVIALYLMSEGFRDVVFDFESWVERRRQAKLVRDYSEEDDVFGYLQDYAAKDIEMTQAMYPVKFDTVYDEVAFARETDPLRQAARDFNTLTTATEFHNADRPTD